MCPGHVREDRNLQLAANLTRCIGHLARGRRQQHHLGGAVLDRPSLAKWFQVPDQDGGVHQRHEVRVWTARYAASFVPFHSDGLQTQRRFNLLTIMAG